jgi:hypothetical protein
VRTQFWAFLGWMYPKEKREMEISSLGNFRRRFWTSF